MRTSDGPRLYRGGVRMSSSRHKAGRYAPSVLASLYRLKAPEADAVTATVWLSARSTAFSTEVSNGCLILETAVRVSAAEARRKANAFTAAPLTTVACGDATKEHTDRTVCRARSSENDAHGKMGFALKNLRLHNKKPAFPCLS